MLCFFLTILAVFSQFEFFGSIEFVSLADVVAPFTDGAGQSEGKSCFAFFLCHVCKYTKVLPVLLGECA